MNNKEIYDECIKGINIFMSIANQLGGGQEDLPLDKFVKSEYLTAQQARAISSGKIQCEYPKKHKKYIIDLITEFASRGNSSVTILGDDDHFANYGFKYFLENLGYRVSMQKDIISGLSVTISW